MKIAILPDIMQHDLQHSLEKSRGFSYEDIISYRIKQIINECDVVIGNLETTVSRLPISGFPKFNAHPNLIRELSKDIDILCLANNHMFDNGEVAIADTCNILEYQAVNWVGVYNTPILYKDGYIITNFTDVSNIKVSENIVCQKLPDIEVPKGDLGILIVHSGEEYNSKLTNRQNEIFNQSKDLGYQIIIQMHSHVIGEQLIFEDNIFAVNGMGNFLSYQKNTLNDGVFYVIDTDGDKLLNYTGYEIKTEIVSGKQQVILK